MIRYIIFRLFAAIPTLLLISALIFGVPLVAIGIFTALRQRVKLEQAWRVIYRRATAWRDNIAHRFPKDIEALEAAINRQSLESARDILRRRRAELEAFRILGLTPFTASIDAAMTLMPEGWAWSLVNERERALSGDRPSCFADARLPYRTSYQKTAHAWARTPALALCAAALRARAGMEG